MISEPPAVDYQSDLCFADASSLKIAHNLDHFSMLSHIQPDQPHTYDLPVVVHRELTAVVNLLLG